MYYVLFCPLTPFISWQRPHPASPPCIGIMYHIMKMDNEHTPLPPPMSTPIQFVLELCIMLWIVLWYHVIKLATEITFVLKASQRHHPCIGIRYYVMKLGTEILLYQIPLVSPPLRQHHHHPPCIMFWNTNIIPMHNMTTGKLGTEILLHQIPSVPPPLRQYHHHPPCIMFWNTNIIPIHNMTTGKFLNRSLTENWPAVLQWLPPHIGARKSPKQRFELLPTAIGSQQNQSGGGLEEDGKDSELGWLFPRTGSWQRGWGWTDLVDQGEEE